MFKRENTIGLLLLLFCVVVGAVMVRAIITGEQPEVDLPPYVSWPLGIAFVGMLFYGMFVNFRDRRSGGDGPAWPNPQSGRKSLWDRWRDRKNDDRG